MTNALPPRFDISADDIARVVAWLASDEADYICGASIYVDGGMTLFPGFATGG